MHELRCMVIDCRHRTLPCSVEAYVNSRLEELQYFNNVSDVKLEKMPAPDYFVFSYTINNVNEKTVSLEEFCPPDS